MSQSVVELMYLQTAAIVAVSFQCFADSLKDDSTPDVIGNHEYPFHGYLGWSCSCRENCLGRTRHPVILEEIDEIKDL
ncbi:MAG: hypothetical protein HOC70_11310 [Gammaproteobacteria bacterium]|nr:hypothetical protein [Gammaproteobacteria bacterium]MBT4493821.1 hypothetical protein [Gammaproteobacteria bacterium]